MLRPPNKLVYIVSPDPQKVEGLELAWPKLRIILNKSTPYFQKARKRGTDVTFLGLPKLTQTTELLEHPKVLARLKRGSRLIVFKNLPKIEKLAARRGWKVLMPGGRFINLIEDKIHFADFCRQHELPTLPTQISSLKTYIFRSPIVVQFRRGHAGETTFFVRSREELRKLKKTAGDWQVKITPLMKLPTFSLDLCVGRTANYFTQPFYQITGDPRLNPLPGGTGGIDFGLAQTMLSQASRKKVFELAEKVAGALRKLGYLGIAGIDFLVDNAKEIVYLIECNPRLLSNLGFVTRLQVEAGETPLLTWHILEQLSATPGVACGYPGGSRVRSGRFELVHPNTKPQVYC